MTDGDDLLLRLLAGKVKIRRLVGTFVAASTAGCTVDVGNGRIPARFGSGYIPEVNETIEVWVFDDDVAYVMAPTLTKPGQGTVKKVTGNTVLLDTDYGQVTAPFLGSAPAAGQVMGLRWQGGPLALGVMSTSPPAPTPPPPPPQTGTVHVDVFSAIDAGSFNRYGWQQAQVWSSDSYQGAWFYGTKIANTIPSSAAVRKVELYLSPQQIQYAPPNFSLHPHPSKPGGAPAFGATQPVAAVAGWIELPLSWGDALKAGGGSFGVGVNHGGYSIFRSLAQDGLSGQMRITSTY